MSKVRNLFIALISVLALISCGHPGKPAGRGVIDSFIGSVNVRGLPAKVGMQVTKESLVLVASNSRVDIVFDDKNIFEIVGPARVMLDIEESIKKIKLYEGSIANILRNLRSSPDQNALYEIETSTAVVSVRGTTFYVRADSSSRVYVCACNGSLQLQDARNKTNFNVVSTHHKAYWLIKKDNSIVIKEAAMLFHTDQGLENLAKKIGVKMDWTKLEK